MLIPVLLIVAFVLLLIYNKPETRLCRWREYRMSEATRWTCVHCGATIDYPKGQSPTRCHREDAAQ
ncbi:RNase P subunit RPR2 [Sagittula marina]|uniref:RNase P subunit RPR2 n=1 Tax=Sagittula marina TaxID=943940 RepID=A0A7W6GU69_9RHOB|nr:RNase P subunit RPR2 [Sagittula marina]